MKTQATDDYPEIEWEIGDLISYDSEERERVFAGTGIGVDGKKYSCCIYCYCNEFEKVEDIQLEN